MIKQENKSSINNSNNNEYNLQTLFKSNNSYNKSDNLDKKNNITNISKNVDNIKNILYNGGNDTDYLNLYKKYKNKYLKLKNSMK